MHRIDLQDFNSKIKNKITLCNKMLKKNSSQTAGFQPQTLMQLRASLYIVIGESLFFDLLIYHALSFADQAIKTNSLNIERTLGEIISENFENKNKQCMGSLTFLSPGNFAVFDCGYFFCYCLQKVENCRNCSN